MFVFGLMNIVALIVLTIIMTLEKRAVFGNRVAQLTGVTLIALGLIYALL